MKKYFKAIVLSAGLVLSAGFLSSFTGLNAVQTCSVDIVLQGQTVTVTAPCDEIRDLIEKLEQQ